MILKRWRIVFKKIAIDLEFIISTFTVSFLTFTSINKLVSKKGGKEK